MSTNTPAPSGVARYGVIVTGASGLGLAYGEALAEHGARVTLIEVDNDAVGRANVITWVDGRARSTAERALPCR